MIIRCTKDLRTQINPPMTEAPDDLHPLFSWHAKKMKMHGRNAVLVVNDSNRYAVVLYGLAAKDIRKLHEYLPAAIERLFEAESIRPDVIAAYLEQAGPVVYGTTGTRQNIARLNRAGLELEHYIADTQEESVVQTEASLWLSDYLVSGKDGYFIPNEAMRDDLKEVLGLDSVGFPALQLKVAAQYGDQEFWRRIVIPEELLQRYLGAVINIAFGRQMFAAYELHWKEAQERGVPAVAAAQKIPTHGRTPVPVEPDKLAETWTYEVETERIVEDEFYNRPQCLDGQGGFELAIDAANSKGSSQSRALEFIRINRRLEKIRS